jgi:trans-aconitate 2-methyltransferase
MTRMPHEFDGRAYERHSAHQREWGSHLIDNLDLRGTERVLDLGCGDGTLTCRLANRVQNGTVLGIDASRGMIETALPKAQANLQFVQMDIRDLAFVDRFDLIFSNAALHWVEGHDRLLDRIQMALRPGGRLRFNFAGHGNCSSYVEVVRDAMRLPEYSALFTTFRWPYYMPSVEAYRAVMLDSGLDGVRVWGEPADRHFPTEAAVVGWLDQPSLVPFLAALPSDARGAFRAVVVNRMLNKTRCDDGRYFETFRRINVAATKRPGGARRGLR